VFAFPKGRKEPLTDADHVRNAIVRFDQTIGGSDEDRALAFANIKKAAEYYGVEMSESDWRQLGTQPSTGRTRADRRRSARKAAATHKRRAAKASRKTSARKTSARGKTAASRKRTAAPRKASARKSVKTASARKTSTRRTSARRATGTRKRPMTRRSK
jgi:hypothetical protein